MPKKKECSCELCRECCTREAGWFLPDEIAPAAAHLQMSEEDFVETYCQKHILENKAVALSPKTKPGKRSCIFYVNGLCTIHDVKPYECRKVFACEPARKHARTRELVARQWK